MSIPISAGRRSGPFPALSNPDVDLGRTCDQMVGRTPLLALRRIAPECPDVQILAKAEWFNPGGSIKDRPVLRMIEEAERSGRLTPGSRLLDATSGNTGIAYAWIAAMRGYGVTLCVPSGVTPERLRILRALGAQLVLTDPQAGSDGAIREARRLAIDQPDRFVYLDQYSDENNWKSHYLTTGPEILEQTRGRLTHFVTALGTGGTFTGVSRRLAESAPLVQRVAVQPDSPFHGLEGLKHMETALVPSIYDPSLVHEFEITGTEESYAMVRRLAREEGLLVGVSSGANVLAAVRVARRIGKGVVVTILCDGAFKYLSERFWDET